MSTRNFEAALAAMLRHEGGYVDHPADPGGATNMGITRAVLAQWRGRAVSKAEVRALTRAEVAAIYRARYWNAIRGDLLPAGVDLALFDFAVNAGPGRAVKTMQRVLNLEADGVVGPRTLAAMQRAEPAVLVRQLCAARSAFLARLSTFPVFGRGWSARVKSIEAQALALAGQHAASAPLATQENTMDMSKTLFASRTLWANSIGLLAVALSAFGFNTAGFDAVALTEHLFQAVAALSFVASSVFRVLASKRLV